jgi:hypothetical protein
MSLGFARWRCPLDPRQGPRALGTATLVGSLRRANAGVERSRSALLREPTSGQIAKGLALCRGSKGQRPLVATPVP